jgi:hypothetical protein
MENIQRENLMEINYQNIIEKLRLEVERYREALYISKKNFEVGENIKKNRRVSPESALEDIYSNFWEGTEKETLETDWNPKVDSEKYSEDHLKHYLYNIDKSKIEIMDRYLDFLEKIIATGNRSYVEKWFKKYREFIYHDWVMH